MVIGVLDDPQPQQPQQPQQHQHVPAHWNIDLIVQSLHYHRDELLRDINELVLRNNLHEACRVVSGRIRQDTMQGLLDVFPRYIRGIFYGMNEL